MAMWSSMLRLIEHVEQFHGLDLPGQLESRQEIDDRPICRVGSRQAVAHERRSSTACASVTASPMVAVFAVMLLPPGVISYDLRTLSEACGPEP